MKLRSLRSEDTPQLMIIPMIDIIFFLLVFFMLSTLYMTEQETVPLNLPAAHSARLDTSVSTSVAVLGNGRIMYGQEEIPAELLRHKAALQLKAQPDSSFVVRGDKQAEYGRVVAVLDELKAAGVKRVAIAAQRKEN